MVKRRVGRSEAVTVVGGLIPSTLPTMPRCPTRGALTGQPHPDRSRHHASAAISARPRHPDEAARVMENDAGPDAASSPGRHSRARPAKTDARNSIGTFPHGPWRRDHLKTMAAWAGISFAARFSMKPRKKNSLAKMTASITA